MADKAIGDCDGRFEIGIVADQRFVERAETRLLAGPPKKGEHHGNAEGDQSESLDKSIEFVAEESRLLVVERCEEGIEVLLLFFVESEDQLARSLGLHLVIQSEEALPQWCQLFLERLFAIFENVTPLVAASLQIEQESIGESVLGVLRREHQRHLPGRARYQCREFRLSDVDVLAVPAAAVFYRFVVESLPESARVVAVVLLDGLSHGVSLRRPLPIRRWLPSLDKRLLLRR